MSYTNEHIPEMWSVRERLAVRLLQVERDFWRDEVEELRKRLQNVKRSVEENGFVEIRDGNSAIRLVAADQEPQS